MRLRVFIVGKIRADGRSGDVHKEKELYDFVEDWHDGSRALETVSYRIVNIYREREREKERERESCILRSGMITITKDRTCNYSKDK